jgi:hypothetical protein
MRRATVPSSTDTSRKNNDRRNRQNESGHLPALNSEAAAESPPRHSPECPLPASATSNLGPSCAVRSAPPSHESSLPDAHDLLPMEVAVDAIAGMPISDMNPAPEGLEAIKPRDWSFVEEEQARKQASGASKRRKDPLQKSDIAAGGRQPSIDHSALYSGGNLCMMLSMKDKVQAQRVLDALRELHARKGRRGNAGDLMEKHHLTSHIYFGNLSTEVLQYYCARYRLATPTHSSHERLADAVARHFNAVEPPLETDVLTNLIHHKLPASL